MRCHFCGSALYPLDGVLECPGCVQRAFADRNVAFRQFDPNVGGGVDRDTLPTSDFGDPKKRAFPIVTPKDVADAGHLVGRAASPASVKARVKSIAKRKGSAFVKQLPDAWQRGASPDDLQH